MEGYGISPNAIAFRLSLLFLESAESGRCVHLSKTNKCLLFTL